MDRRILFLIIAVLLIGTAGYFIVSGDAGDYSKVIVIRLHVAKDGVSSESEQVRYGHAPVSGLVNGVFRATFSDRDGETVQDFGVHDPRVQFGDRIISSEGESEVLSGITVVSDRADMLLIVPYTGKEEKFTLSDTVTGKTLASVDLAPAVAEFEGTYPEDPGTVSRAKDRDSPISFPVLLGGGVLLVILFFILIILMIRRE